MPERLTLAPPICRLAGEISPIERRVMQKDVVIITLLSGDHKDVSSLPVPIRTSHSAASQEQAGCQGDLEHGGELHVVTSPGYCRDLRAPSYG